MAINYVNGNRLFYAFLAGTREIARNKAELNRINLFPVYDSDTGNNLAATFNYMVDTVKPTRSIKETFHYLADASLNGARGNSGIIMAQFVNGLSREIGHKARISTRAFADAVKRAVPYAYSAVSHPVEGTILTVINEWAHDIHKLGQETNDFVKLILQSAHNTRASLKENSNKLKLLKDAGVVDAGALGFVLFLEGIAGMLKKGNLKEILQDRSESIELVEPLKGVSGDVKLRYCSEALLTGVQLDHDQLRSAVQDFGDSLIVAGSPEKAKIHMHTNKPEDFFFTLRNFGTVIHQKVDDMQRQYQVVHQRKSNIALVTDSIADLPQNEIDKYQVHMLPINLNIEGSAFLDKVSVKPGQIFSVLDELKEYPTSSQPSLNAVRQHLSFLASNYDSVIAITVSKELSGTWNVFNTVAEELSKEGKKVTIINSCLNSGAQGLLVLQAARLIDEGLSHDAVVQRIEACIPDTKIFVSVATLKYMVRGGRVSPMKGLVANLLNFKPIVSLDENGRAISFANALSRKANTKKIVSIVDEINKKKPIGSYCLVHAKAPDKAKEYENIFTALLDKAPEYVEEISPIVALNAGIGAIAVCIMPEKEVV